ncbi:MAG TPA: hypothetical protein PK139_01490 [bacterium]|jgi:hypothetical protein|nr:hypothetical protein [bacterium]
MKELMKELVKHPLFQLLCFVFVVFIIVLFTWQIGKKNSSKTTKHDSPVTWSWAGIVDDTIKKDPPMSSTKKTVYLGHDVDLSDSLCVVMWQKESASATRDCDGVSDSVFVTGGPIRGRVVENLFFFKERRFGLESISRDSTKYLPVSVMTNDPTQTQLWREKSNQNLMYYSNGLFNAVEMCAGTFLFPEETQRIIDDMVMCGIFIPESPTAMEIKTILTKYANLKKRAINCSK